MPKSKSRMQDTERRLSLNNISQSKRSQLINCIDTPSFYLQIASYHADPTGSVILYNMDVGVQVSGYVIEATVETRYSEIRKLREDIQRVYPDLKEFHRFPAKKYFGRMDPAFLETRMQQLNDWLGHLNRSLSIRNMPTFVTTFHLESFELVHILQRKRSFSTC